MNKRCPSWPTKVKQCRGVLRKYRWKAWAITKCSLCEYGGRERAGMHVGTCECGKVLFRSNGWDFCADERCRNYHGKRSGS